MEHFKDLSHMIENWWKMSSEFATQVNSNIFKNVSFFSKPFFDFDLQYAKTLSEYTPTTWWIVSIIILPFITLPIYLFNVWPQKRLRSLTSNIPGPFTLPILGSIPTFAGCNLVQFFQKLVKVMNKHGPIVRIWMKNKLYIVISDPDSIENILVNRSLIKKNVTVSKIVNGNCVGEPDDEKWKIHRRIVSSYFNSNVLEQFMANFAKNSFHLSESLKSVAKGGIFDIYPHFCRCALDIICETMMGTNINIQMEGDGEFMKNLLQSLETMGNTFQKPWILSDWMKGQKQELEKDKHVAMQYLYTFIDKVIAEKLETKQNGVRLKKEKLLQVEYVQWVRGREMTLLDLLVEDDQLSVEEIRDELCTLIVAGTKMTAVTCCYVLSLMGVHQDLQDRVLEEQGRIFGADMQRYPTAKDLNSMKYLEQVMKETLRLYPPVSFLFRTIEEDTHLENGYILPKGCYAVIFNYMTHRNPEYFPDPEHFDPHRFSSETNPGSHPYCYIPFGGGRRICVAYKYGMMGAKTILSAVLRRYHVLQTPGGTESIEANLQAGTVLKPANGFNVKMLPRQTRVIPSIFRQD